jgi:DNA-binding transcriptional LysR family regulator
MYAVLPEASLLMEKEAITLSDIADQHWILFERKAHPSLHEAILRRAAQEEIVVRNAQTVLTAEDAAQLVNKGLGVAFVGMSGARRIAERGAIVRPIADEELRLQICLASRADNRSKLVSEFARAFMRQLSQVRKPSMSTRETESKDGLSPAAA